MTYNTKGHFTSHPYNIYALYTHVMHLLKIIVVGINNNCCLLPSVLQGQSVVIEINKFDGHILYDPFDTEKLSYTSYGIMYTNGI